MFTLCACLATRWQGCSHPLCGEFSPSPAHIPCVCVKRCVLLSPIVLVSHGLGFHPPCSHTTSISTLCVSLPSNRQGCSHPLCGEFSPSPALLSCVCVKRCVLLSPIVLLSHGISSHTPCSHTTSMFTLCVSLPSSWQGCSHPLCHRILSKSCPSSWFLEWLLPNSLRDCVHKHGEGSHSP